MVLKKIKTKREYGFFLDFYSTDLLPKELLSEIEEFRKRNAIVQIASRVEDKKPIHVCCEKCLNAFIMKKSDEMGLRGGVLVVLNTMIEHKTGHDGYYMDGSELIKS